MYFESDQIKYPNTTTRREFSFGIWIGMEHHFSENKEKRDHWIFCKRFSGTEYTWVSVNWHKLPREREIVSAYERLWTICYVITHVINIPYWIHSSVSYIFTFFSFQSILEIWLFTEIPPAAPIQSIRKCNELTRIINTSTNIRQDPKRGFFYSDWRSLFRTPKI